MTIHQNDAISFCKSLDSKSIDLILTDPPYGFLKHEMDRLIDTDEFFAQAWRILKPNSFIVFFGQQPTLTDWNASCFKWFKYKTEIIWYKRQASSMVGEIARVYENITIAVKGNRQLNPVKRPYIDVKESLLEFWDKKSVEHVLAKVKQVFKDEMTYQQAVDYLNGNKVFSKKRKVNEFVTQKEGLLSGDKKLQSLHTFLNGYKAQNLVSFTPHNKQKYNCTEYNVKHPAVKPTQLIEYLILLCTDPLDRILDPFVGSGTTAIAARNLDREFVGCDISQTYVDMAKDRLKETYHTEIMI